jgi:hypothetical protein
MGTSDSAALYYEMKVQGLLDANRLGWFEGLEIRYEGDTTTVSGLVPDAAALYGVIGRARDLGLTLISVVSKSPGPRSSRHVDIRECGRDE